MTWVTVPACDIRRRAVVGGRLLDDAGQPWDGACTLVLVGGQPERRFEGALRAGACFFFLDVPAGAYALERRNAAGVVVQTRKLAVPAYGGQTRMPVVKVDVEVVDPARSPAAAPSTERNRDGKS